MAATILIFGKIMGHAPHEPVLLVHPQSKSRAASRARQMINEGLLHLLTLDHPLRYFLLDVVAADRQYSCSAQILFKNGKESLEKRGFVVFSPDQGKGHR